MARMYTLSALALISVCAVASAQSPVDGVQLPVAGAKVPHVLYAQSTLPVVLTRTVSADHAKAGDPVLAKTLQAVQLQGGGQIPPGARVTGHVVAAAAFDFDATPYAKQKPAVLSVRFDAVQIDGQDVPLNITVRAVADPLRSNDAYEPLGGDMDARSTRTLIGGNQMYGSQDGVENAEGDVVAYNRRDGVYAHLISSGTCDGSSVEVSMGIYSPSACGVYGFAGIHATERGSAAMPSTLTMVSARRSPELPKRTTALLEVLPSEQASVAR